MYVTGDQWVKFFVTRNATFDTLTFDPASPVAGRRACKRYPR